MGSGAATSPVLSIDPIGLEPVAMWYYVAENPWYLAGAFGLAAAGFLVALKLTQDGRNLTRALIALGLAAVVLVVEQWIVTDVERVEWAVKDLVRALSENDTVRVIALMDDRVTFSIRDKIANELDHAWFARELGDLTFDWLHLSRLTASAGQQTHRGSAGFKLGAAGTYRMNGIGHNFAGNSEWSLGFRRLPSGEWKITRITAQVLPAYMVLPGLQLRSSGGSSGPRSLGTDGTRLRPGPDTPEMTPNQRSWRNR